MQRREFLKTAASAGIAFPFLANSAEAGQKIRMGFIGIGNRGSQLLALFREQPDVEVAALCDIYEPYLRRDASAVDPMFAKLGLGNRIPKLNEKFDKPPKLYHDYRKLLEDKGIDAVCIATPDHWHAKMTIDAIHAGKDVYCEKPLTATIHEGRAMVNAQAASRQVVAVGLNRRGSESYQRLKKEIDSGKYGRFIVGRAVRCSNLFPHGIGHVEDSDPPKGFDWDAWLGPRAFRPYRYTTAPYFFRWHGEFSSQMGNWGVHFIDAMRWMMGETAPCAITAIGGKYLLDHDGDIPDTMEVSFEFADKKLIHFSIYEASNGQPIAKREVEIQGSRGVVYADERGFDILPCRGSEFLNPRKADFDPVNFSCAMTLIDDGSAKTTSGAVVRNFLDCVKTRGTPLCTLEEGHRSTSFAHLANIALKMGQRLEWDAKAERFTNCPKANDFLQYDYRDGYTLA
jgi:predicted dehydrogenase